MMLVIFLSISSILILLLAILAHGLCLVSSQSDDAMYLAATRQSTNRNRLRAM